MRGEHLTGEAWIRFCSAITIGFFRSTASGYMARRDLFWYAERYVRFIGFFSLKFSKKLLSRILNN